MHEYKSSKARIPQEYPNGAAAERRGPSYSGPPLWLICFLEHGNVKAIKIQTDGGDPRLRQTSKPDP